jgi:hypothetical protein
MRRSTVLSPPLQLVFPGKKKYLKNWPPDLKQKNKFPSMIKYHHRHHQEGGKNPNHIFLQRSSLQKDFIFVFSHFV